ncbi:phosphate regulon sensor histidine kinase PhoR [Castellaniella denitrificans]|uniref:phosphate regulon sensor histidine kinase PhoR n=1 Tax=Castellaniella denitrificans TaxID=56119 RepID=UPI001AD600F6|nr:phosphate regulon sensor histidine kinase PhoR [Burkholderiales bacterium]
MSKTLVSIALWALGGWLLGAWLGAATGWAVFALGLLLMVLASGLQLSRIARWVRAIDEPPPPSVGPWDEILAPIYRKLKQNRLDLQDRTRSFHRALLAAEALPDGALTLDPDKSLQWCNQTAANHLGLDLERDRGHSILNIVRAPEFARYADQEAWDRPLILHLGSDGRARTLSLHLAPYGVGQFLMVTRDITQIERLENTRKDFVANVSHELRTPLTVLSGFVETLQDMPGDALTDEQRRHYLDLMAQQARNMQALVSDLLTLSSLESTPNREGGPVPVTALVRTALAQAQALSGGRHTFDVRLDETLRIRGQDTELASAIGNLLTNAVRYTPAGGAITILWESTPDGGAVYRVRDTGIGIDPADIPRLTERFFRVDRGRSRATGGTGLGLAIAKHVAMRHEAALDIQSTPGEGSVFSILFPAARVCPPADPLAPPARDPADSSARAA